MIGKIYANASLTKVPIQFNFSAERYKLDLQSVQIFLHKIVTNISLMLMFLCNNHKFNMRCTSLKKSYQIIFAD